MTPDAGSRPVDPSKLLKIYLGDQLAGSAGWLALAKRCASSNKGSSLGGFLESLITDIERDKAELEQIMDSVGARKSIGKQAAMRMLVKFGRLKLNGRVTGYSDLSRVLELEGLAMGIGAKLRLWRSLMHVKDDYPELAGVDLAKLAERATSQRERLENFRVEAAQLAFGREPLSPEQ